LPEVRQLAFSEKGEDMTSVLQLRGQAVLAFLLALATLAAVPANAQRLTLKHAVELALAHSPTASQVRADELRADASFRELRNNYIPQVMVGSGLGDTWGYPLSLEGSAPSLFNVTAQSALFNPALRDSIRAARADKEAAQYTAKDRHNQIVQDTVLAYLELAKWQGLTDYVHQQLNQATKMEQITEQRIQAGIDNPQMLTRAKLAAARANLHVLQAKGAQQSLLAILSQLTGLAGASIEIDKDSIPAFPELPSSPDLAATAADSNPAVLFAQKHAIAMGFRARAERRSLWPSVDFATQYAVLAKYNNWQQFFLSNAFERNNATIGIVIRFPFFNASQHAHAEAADADAARAKAEAQSAKDQVSQQIMKMQNSAKQLAAAKEVSELEYELAKGSFNDVKIRMDSGNATVLDEATARADMSEKYDQLQDADFDLVRARVGLLTVTGDLDSWIGIRH
jgi:outer membrane protein TolC